MFLLALGYGRKQRKRKKRLKENFIGDTTIFTGLKKAKEKKRWSEVRKKNPLDERTKDDR
jgi:hypothetical protein